METVPGIGGFCKGANSLEIELKKTAAFSATSLSSFDNVSLMSEITGFSVYIGFSFFNINQISD